MSAPVFNAVNLLKGRVAPSRFWEANREADERITELDRLRRDNAKLREQLDALLSSPVAELHCRVEELEEELADLHQLHMRVVNEAAGLRRERDGLRAQVSAGGGL